MKLILSKHVCTKSASKKIFVQAIFLDPRTRVATHPRNSDSERIAESFLNNTKNYLVETR